VPVAILEGGIITAWRTAALSGVAVRLLARVPGGRAARAVLVGAGAQGRAHAAVLGAVLPGVELAIHDRHPERSDALAQDATGFAGVGGAVSEADPLGVCRTADVIVSATSVGRSQPVLGVTHVALDALVVPVDYGAWVRSEVVRAATTVAVDDRATYDANRANGRLDGWPPATAVLGEILSGGPNEATLASGIAVALHQGPAIADLMVADAVLRRAVDMGVGTLLPR
jgi:ornithine cyclodeaminase/alanine dehydrogenase-like protein (mu-crystallin family)